VGDVFFFVCNLSLFIVQEFVLKGGKRKWVMSFFVCN